MRENNDSLSSVKNPKISVIIPLYNHETYIKEAIDSVLNQSCDDFELIVINDGSTDNSEGVVKNIHDKRILYHYQENQGAHSALNRGISLARGEYISILNSDDVYDTRRFEKMVSILENESTHHAVFSHIEFIDGNGNFLRLKKGAEDNWLGHDPETSFRGTNNIILDLLAGNFLHTTSNLFCRKSVFDNIGHFSNLQYLHDYDFFLRLCYHYKIHVIEEPLLKYRFHESNTLNENYSVANLETGLVLTNFLLKYDLKDIFGPQDNPYTTMAKFFNSLNTYNTDKMIMTLLLFGMKYNKDISDNLFGLSENNNKNPFSNACIDDLKKYRDVSLLKEALAWQEGQTELWWRETGELKNEVMRLREEIKLSDENFKRAQERAQEEIRSLSEKEKQLNDIVNSTKWKLLMKMNSVIDKIFPPESKRRLWFKDFLKNIF